MVKEVTVLQMWHSSSEVPDSVYMLCNKAWASWARSARPLPSPHGEKCGVGGPAANTTKLNALSLFIHPSWINVIIPTNIAQLLQPPTVQTSLRNMLSMVNETLGHQPVHIALR